MGLTTRLFDAKVYALLTLPYCFSISSSLLGYTNFQALLHDYYFLNIRVGHRSPGMFSIFLHQRWWSDLDNNTRAISAYCIPQLIIPWKLSLTLPDQASPTSLQQACSPGHTVHLPGVGYNLEGQLQLFQDLSQVCATLKRVNLLSSLAETFSFLFQVSLFFTSILRIKKEPFQNYKR